MLRVSQVKLTIDEDLDQLEEKLCKKLRISKDELIRFSIVRESIEAIRSAASEIRQINGQAGRVREIDERAEHILSLAEMVAE